MMIIIIINNNNNNTYCSSSSKSFCWDDPSGWYFNFITKCKVNPLQGKWVDEYKPDQVEKSKYRSRYVVKGFRQKKGIEYRETFSPVISSEALLTFLSCYGHFKQQNLELYKLDSHVAFMQPEIEDAVLYLQIPEEWNKINPNCNALLLKKGLYGLKQASLQWYNMVTKTLAGTNAFQNPVCSEGTKNTF